MTFSVSDTITMTLGKNFQFILYFRVLLAPNIGAPSLVSCPSVKKKEKKKKKSSVSLSVVWADKKHQGFPVPLYSFCINGWIFFVLKLITQEPVGRNRNCSLSSSADTVKCPIVTIPVAGKWNFCKMAFCLKRGVLF